MIGSVCFVIGIHLQLCVKLGSCALLSHVHNWVRVFCYRYTCSALCEIGSMCVEITSVIPK
jgi:hypothetical protein